ncbi:MAG: phage holin family protein [Patescibacteria group bacterium]
MKKILKHYVVDTVSLYLISQAVTGIIFENGIESLFLAGLGIALTSFLVKPIINLLLLPINLLTFGFFKWISSAITLYIVTLIVPGFKIYNFVFSGFASPWIDIPSLTLVQPLSFIAFSFLITAVTSIIYWLIK